MGEVIPWECITNALYENNHFRTLLFSDCSWMRLVEERVQQQCMVDHTVVESAVMPKLMREDKEEEDEEEGMGEGAGESSSTKDLASKQAPVLQATVPTVPEFLAVGPSVHVARQGPSTTSRAQGKAPAVQVAPIPPAETEK